MPKLSGKKSIVLTGGGSAGHVMPNVALLDRLHQNDWTVSYIGSNAVEKKIIGQIGLPFYEIKTGKLRRYFSWQNFTDPFRIIWGFFQAFGFLLRLRPRIVFSKGGYVSVPVALAAWCLRIPVISHESDLTPGLANKINAKFSKKILYAFPETQKFLPANAVYVGTPIRSDIFNGDREAGRKFVNFESDQGLVILVVGGSLGAVRLNNVILGSLDEILKKYRVIHITGPGKAADYEHPNYRSYAFLDKEFPNVMAFADIVISRAGANAIFEFLAARKPMLLIPLEIGSRGDQVHNASSFVKKGWAYAISERDLTSEKLLVALDKTIENIGDTKKNQEAYGVNTVSQKIVSLFESQIH